MDLANPSTGLLIVYTILASLVALGAVLKGVLPICRWIMRVARQVGGALDNLAGRDEFIDPTTGELKPEIPAIGKRLSVIDQKLDGLANTNTRLDAIDARMVGNEKRLDDHDSSIASLLASTFERGADKALKAVELKNADVIDADPLP